MASRIWIISCGILLLPGCKAGPDYAPPKTAVPTAFGEADYANAEIGSATTRPSLMNSSAQPWVNWWTKFGDRELDSLINRALVSNHEVAAARARVVQARASVQVAQSALWPTIDIGGGSFKSRGSAAGFGSPYGLPGFDSNLYQIGFDATYEADLFGGIRRGIEAAGAQADAAQNDLRSVQLSLLAEVARNYIGLRALQQRIVVVKENLEDQRRTLDVVQRQFDNGLATNFDVIRARTQLLTTESGLPPLEAGVKQSIHGLSVLLGEPPMALSDELTSAAPIPPVPPQVPIGMPSELLRRRPDVMRAERILAAATAEQGVAVSDLFPHLVLGGTAGVQSRRAENLFNQHAPNSGFYLAGPSADWTIFDGGRRWANVDRSKARVAEALAVYEETVLSAMGDVENALTAYSHDQTRRETLKQLVAQAQEAVRIAHSKYSQGLLNLLDVIDVERSLYSSQDELTLADQAVSSDLVGLYKALGGGWETTEAPAPAAPVSAVPK